MSNVWYVRNGGNDTNGGGFDVSYGGTNYAYQDTAQVSALVGDATIYVTNDGEAVVVSQTGIDDSNYLLMFGNYVHITGSVHAVEGWYNIVGLSQRITPPLRYYYILDRTATTTSGLVAVTAKIGGAFATSPQATTLMGLYGGTIDNETAGSPHVSSSIQLLTTGTPNSIIRANASNTFIIRTS